MKKYIDAEHKMIRAETHTESMNYGMNMDEYQDIMNRRLDMMVIHIEKTKNINNHISLIQRNIDILIEICRIAERNKT